MPMLLEDRRNENVLRYVATDDPETLMQISDEIRKCVVFLAIKDYGDPTKYKFIGTAFYLSRNTIHDSAHTYLITAKHLFLKLIDQVDQVFIRLNRKDGGAEWIPTNVSDWLYHPSDESVDVAALKLAWPPECDHLSYPVTLAAVRAAMPIQIGSDVFITGLFDAHRGLRRNIPIIRVGNIAALPEEKIWTENFGLIDAYLIEVRSIGGLSGSPVFLHTGTSRTVHVAGANPFRRGPVFYLLGLMHGHFGASRAENDSTIEDVVTQEKINYGIGIVVPVEKIFEVLMQPKMIALDERADAFLMKRQAELAIEDEKE